MAANPTFTDFGTSLKRRRPIYVLAAGLLALYGPTFIELSTSLWAQEEHAHGPIVFAMLVWLVWRKLGALTQIEYSDSTPAAYPLALIGCLLYVIGRSQSIVMLEVGSIIPLATGTILLVRGKKALRVMWFPLLFCVFLIPLPGVLVELLTGSLKHAVSAVAANLLYAGGYPVARDGVTLSVGPYYLLVADACSGLNSMYSLSALGLFYLYLMRHISPYRNAALLLAIPLIAFFANIVRVLMLVLVTYHFNDEAGQGFIHDFAGMLLFAVALALLWITDRLLGLIPQWRNTR